MHTATTTVQCTFETTTTAECAERLCDALRSFGRRLQPDFERVDVNVIEASVMDVSAHFFVDVRGRFPLSENPPEQAKQLDDLGGHLLHSVEEFLASPEGEDERPPCAVRIDRITGVGPE